MSKSIKRGTLAVAQASGVDALIDRSSWRAGRVLILCYHGISLEREHEWDPELYMSPEAFTQRLEILKKRRCSVLPLDEAMVRTANGTLPPRSVVITFDDGMADFYLKAAPLLKAFDFPATVYLTSFYAAFNRPVFFVACSYLLWKYRDRLLGPVPFASLSTPASIAAASGRTGILSAIEAWLQAKDPSAEQQHALLKEFAAILGVDIEDFSRRRILHIMTPAEARKVSDQGFSVELHTHRHRTPSDKELFTREITQNRQCIRNWTGQTPRHFCYPMGIARPEFDPWLRELGVVSATTCVPGLASSSDNPMLLPRLIDHSGLSTREFESWLSGTGAMLRNMKALTA